MAPTFLPLRQTASRRSKTSYLESLQGPTTKNEAVLLAAHTCEASEAEASDLSSYTSSAHVRGPLLSAGRSGYQSVFCFALCSCASGTGLLRVSVKSLTFLSTRDGTWGAWDSLT